MSESGGASFGDAAGEMANETEVEVPVSGTSAPAGASANAGHQPPTADESGPADTSGVGDMVEEGAPLEPADLAEASAVEPSVEDQLAERTADLQRLSAEYANYRKRVDRERLVVAQNAAFKALTPVIDVLDTIDRAREHGELEEGFKAVADQLERAVTLSGLTRFGAPGEAFDPNLHEALSHLGTDADVEGTTIKHLAKAGYLIGDRVVRAAQVLVVDPAED